MLSMKHFVCCGIDVHKKFIVATIATTDYRGVTSYLKKRFATFNSDLKSLVQCANAAIKDRKNPYFKYKYDCIKNVVVINELSLLLHV